MKTINLILIDHVINICIAYCHRRNYETGVFHFVSLSLKNSWGRQPLLNNLETSITWKIAWWVETIFKFLKSCVNSEMMT